MAKEKALSSKSYPQFEAGEQASHAKLPLEVIHIIMEFLKADPKSLARYLAVNRENRAQSRFFNNLWKNHAKKDNLYCLDVRGEIDNLPEKSNKNYKSEIAKIFTKAKGQKLAVKYKDLTTPPPGPDAEAYETNPNAGKGPDNEMVKVAVLPVVVAFIGFIAGACIAHSAGFNRSGSIAFSILFALLGLLLGAMPTIYPCIQACRVKQQIKENEFQASILAYDEEKSEGSPLLPSMQRI